MLITQSVNLRNRELLEENKVLYQKVKEVLEKAEMEKVRKHCSFSDGRIQHSVGSHVQERTTVYYTKRLDKARAKHNKGTYSSSCKPTT